MVTALRLFVAATYICFHALVLFLVRNMVRRNCDADVPVSRCHVLRIGPP